MIQSKMTSKITQRALLSSTKCSPLTTTRPSVQSNQKHGFNCLSKLIIIINVILLHCIVGNLCASWQENVRPKLFVQLGELKNTQTFFVFINLNKYIF